MYHSKKPSSKNYQMNKIYANFKPSEYLKFFRSIEKYFGG